MIVVIGEALVDLVIEADGRVSAALGGAPFNTARACGRLGADVRFAGAISVDRFGTLLNDRLVADGVDVAHVARVDVPTTLAAAELDSGGAASYRFYIDGTSAPLTSGLSDLAVGDGDLVFTGGLGLVLQPMADRVEAFISGLPEGVLRVVDVNCRPLVIADRDAYLARVDRVIAGADIVKASDEDLAYLAPDRSALDAARDIVDRGAGAVLVTAGGDGVTVVTADGTRHVPVEPVEVVDTIGAGDTFGAAFITWWTEHDAPRTLDALATAVAAANAAAAIACTRRGADPPRRAELGWD